MPVETADEIAEALTREERIVADCVILAAEGKTQRQIGKALNIRQQAVADYLGMVRGKVEV